jgi:hypothetical protein
MTVKIQLSIVCIVIALVCCETLHADIDCPARPQKQPEIEALASEWFSTATDLVNQGHFASGSEAFQCSYQILPHPYSLFNAALAAQKADMPQKACALFADYIQLTPNDAKRADVQKEMRSLDCGQYGISASIDPSPSVPSHDKPAVLQPQPHNQLRRNSPSPPESKSPPPDYRPSARFQSEPMPLAASSDVPPLTPYPGKIAIGLLFLGGTGILTGTIFQIMAADAQSDLKTIHYTPEFEQRRDDMHLYQRNALIGFIGGSVLALTGLTIHLISHRKRMSRTSIGLLPTWNGGYFTTEF